VTNPTADISDSYRILVSPDGALATVALQAGSDSEAKKISEHLQKFKCRDLRIEGSLGDCWRIRSSGSITVTGTVGAAMVNAKTLIDIQGGIDGKNKGKCITEQSLVTEFLSNACVVASGDVTVRGDVIQSKIMCGGKVTGGTIAGGKISANQGVTCKSIGNSDGTATIVEAGTNQMLPLIAAMGKIELELDSRRERELRAQIDALLKSSKTLTARDREKAMELEFEADQIKTSAAEKKLALDEHVRAIRDAARGEIAVSDRIFPGTVLRIKQHEVVIRNQLAGPVKIRIRKTKESTEVVMFQGDDQNGKVLESRRLDETPLLLAA
jgi:uncharacterized protein (DUF342 family)